MAELGISTHYADEHWTIRHNSDVIDLCDPVLKRIEDNPWLDSSQREK